MLGEGRMPRRIRLVIVTILLYFFWDKMHFNQEEAGMNSKLVMFGLTLSLVFSAIPIQAATVDCTSGNPNPVCQASFAAKAAGWLDTGEQISGTAVVRGKKVKWTCTAGTRSPRRCIY
jgi:hypothetical protein